MKKINIDPELCIGCGECAKDCVSGHIKIVDGKATVPDVSCIKCGHCYAICPVGAVSLSYITEPECGVGKTMSDYDSDEFLMALKSRRSVRRFTDEEVSQEDVLKIIEAGRYCPTASNSQAVNFVVLKNKKDECEAAAVEFFRQSQRLANFFYPALKDKDINDDFFFKGAPLVILTAAKGSVDASLASSYMELMAESLGLGVFYSGFFVAAAKLCKPLKGLLDLPEGLEVITCLVIGHHDVKYSRIPPRKAPKLIIR